MDTTDIISRRKLIRFRSGCQVIRVPVRGLRLMVYFEESEVTSRV
jgi:hypothetical protein